MATMSEAALSHVVRAPWLDTDEFEISIRATAEVREGITLPQGTFDEWAAGWAERVGRTQTLGVGESIPVSRPGADVSFVYVSFKYETKVKDKERTV